MAIITRDRIDTTPTNRDCISNIYGYYENDNPEIPTEIYYRWCKPESTTNGMHRREKLQKQEENTEEGREKENIEEQRDILKPIRCKQDETLPRRCRLLHNEEGLYPRK